MRVPRFAWTGLILVAAFVLPRSSLAQETGWISIQQPEEWRGEGTRGIRVREKKNVRIVGDAFHPTGVTRVLINGERASLDPQPEGQVRFVGFVEARASSGDVEIVAYSQGPPMVRNFRLESVPAPQIYDSPDDAWGSGSGGFEGKRFAVVIGISEFEDPGITPLRYADDDADLFYRFLLSEAAGLGGFEPENVILLKDSLATYRGIRTALVELDQLVTERDVVFVYFAGHGIQDHLRPDDHYLLTYDTDASNIPATAYPMEDITEAVNQLRARDVLVFTDACHAGAVSTSAGVRAGALDNINEEFLTRLTISTGGLVSFTAAEVRQSSQEDSRWGGGHGVFTHFLIRALEGEADADGDRIVTVGEMLEYVREQVQRETRNAQVPAISSTSFDRSWPMAVVTGEVFAEPAVSLPRPEEEPAAPPGGGPGEVDPASMAGVDLMSPAGIFASSLFIPSLGEWKTGQSGRAALILGGVAGAVAYGLLAVTNVEDCRVAAVDGQCPSGEVVRSYTEREALVPALAAAGVLTFIGAIDALSAAKRINRERTQSSVGTTGALLSLFPPHPGGRLRPGDIPILQLRF